jgi:thioredoxin-related protein
MVKTMQDYQLIKHKNKYVLLCGDGREVELCTQIEKEAHKLAKRAIRLLNRTNQNLQ